MKKTAVYFISVLILAGCDSFEQSSKTTETKPQLPKNDYVYRDREGCLHRDLRCFDMRYASDGITISTGEEDSGIPINSRKYAVHRIQISQITPQDLFFCCSGCVSDSDYEFLLSMMSYKGRLEYAHKALMEKGYKAPKDFEEFTKAMSYRQRRDEVDMILKKEGYISPLFAQYNTADGIKTGSLLPTNDDEKD